MMSDYRLSYINKIYRNFEIEFFGNFWYIIESFRKLLNLFFPSGLSSTLFCNHAFSIINLTRHNHACINARLIADGLPRGESQVRER